MSFHIYDFESWEVDSNDKSKPELMDTSILVVKRDLMIYFHEDYEVKENIGNFAMMLFII